jgi:hypothetical protein
VERHTFTPTWRSAKEPVVLVERPTERWFRDLKPCEGGRRLARLVLLQTGELYWGDAYDVLHRDVMAYRKGGVEPVFVGVVVEDERGAWRIGNAQWFLNSITDSGTRHAAAMLSRLAEWPEITAAMGNDPTTLPSLEDAP